MTNIAPHKWPGKEELAKLRVKMRVLSIEEPIFFICTGFGMLEHVSYFNMRREKQKRHYENFRDTVNRDYNRRIK